MILTVDQVHKDRLTALLNLSTDVLREYLRVSLEFLKSGPNQKVYSKAAEKLQISAEEVQNGIEALMYLFVESARAALSNDDFRDSMAVLGFTGDIQQEMLIAYADNKGLVRNVLCDSALDLCHYKDVEWRLDVVLASRSLRHEIKPEVMLRFTLEEDKVPSTVVMQCDLPNLLHLTQTLEEALQELKTPHCNRILRNI